MVRTMLVAMALLFSLVAGYVPVVYAEDAAYEIQSADTVRAILVRQAGKPVTVRLQSGSDIGGTVVKVGDSVVHLTKVSGMDFYDAVVRLDTIAAVLVKVRGR